MGAKIFEVGMNIDGRVLWVRCNVVGSRIHLVSVCPTCTDRLHVIRPQKCGVALGGREWRAVGSLQRRRLVGEAVGDHEEGGREGKMESSFTTKSVVFRLRTHGGSQIQDTSTRLHMCEQPKMC